ncbi:MAG: gluconate 2-dehydrogenase subunit 3 family protein [Candidatus Binatia bacterium]|nr:gluconate 2-dehydrogenase subunit 3 family protein [Candidatus Binatia bacterium]
MERRDFLAGLTALFGGAVAAPCVSFLSRADAAVGNASSPLFTPEQKETVATATELILPTTDTPGARDAGVADFIEMMLVDWYYDDERAEFMAGLARIDVVANERTGKTFVESPEADQVEVLKQLEKEGQAEMAAKGINPLVAFQKKAPAPAFFPALKQLTIVGYYTSKIGGTQELEFNPTPGRFDACVAAGANGRVWVVGF